MNNRKQSRRNFLASLARIAIASGLAVTSGILLMKEKPADGCTKNHLCDNCGKSSHCALPHAVSYRVGKNNPKEKK
jgi:hypothetical protein